MPQTLPTERSFDCNFCQGVIKIPFDLAPTKAPCPYCGKELLSPPLQGELEKPPVLTPIEDVVPKLVPEQFANAPSFSGTPQLVELGQANKLQNKTPDAFPPRSGKSQTGSGAVVVPVPATSVPRVDLPLSAPPKDATPDSASAGALGEDAVAPELLVGSARQAAKEGGSSKKSKGAKRSRNVSPLVFFGGGVALVTLCIVALFLLNRGNKDKMVKVPAAAIQETERNQFLRDGWKKTTTSLMEGFLAAETVEEKAKYVVGGESRIPEMVAFYANREIADTTTPMNAFSHEDLVMADKERGLFMMRYDRPAQFAMNEFFRPVAPLEVQYRVESPDALLATAANLDNFAMDPVRILAFFKYDGGEMRLDWDIYVQTKYRLLKEFMDTPRPGARQVFRVRIHEDVPSVAGSDLTEIRYYRCMDPAHDDDYGKIPVVVDSALGRHLSVLNWVGIKDATIQGRGATVELAWSEDQEPRIYMKRLLCWEYLGLGGVMGNLSLAPGDESAKVALDRTVAGR